MIVYGESLRFKNSECDELAEIVIGKGSVSRTNIGDDSQKREAVSTN